MWLGNEKIMHKNGVDIRCAAREISKLDFTFLRDKKMQLYFIRSNSHDFGLLFAKVRNYSWNICDVI